MPFSTIPQVPDALLQGKLKEYPRVINTLKALWGSKELVTYLNGLMTTDRELRDGFHPEVFSELNAALKLHEQLFPDDKKGTTWV